MRVVWKSGAREKSETKRDYRNEAGVNPLVGFCGERG